MSSDSRDTPPATPPALRPEVAEAIEYIREWYLTTYSDDGRRMGIVVAELERLAAEIAALKAAREWRDIATAPKDGTPVLMLRKDGDIKEARWKETWLDDRGGILHVAAWGGNGWWFPEWDQPTHWMPKPPLPEPPTEDAGS